MPDKSDYIVVAVRGWTKERLAERIESALNDIDPERVVSISYFVESIITLFWRRNSALITIGPARNA